MFDAMYLTKSRLKLLSNVMQISSMLDNFKLDDSQITTQSSSVSDQIIAEIKQCGFVKAFSILQAHSGFNNQDLDVIRIYKILCNLNTICSMNDANSAEQDQLFLSGIRENKQVAMAMLSDIQNGKQVSPLVLDCMPLI